MKIKFCDDTTPLSELALVREARQERARRVIADPLKKPRPLAAAAFLTPEQREQIRIKLDVVRNAADPATALLTVKSEVETLLAQGLRDFLRKAGD